MKNLILLVALVLTVGCTNNNSLSNSANIENNTTKAVDNLDIADDNYIELKSGDASASELKSGALDLANAHMDKQEYILANFYIQEALSYAPGDESLKFMLVKNQYLAAKQNSNSQDYLKKAIRALNENINLITDYNYLTQSQELLKEVKGYLSKSYLETSNFYKKKGKIEASEKYLQKSQDVDANI